MLTALLTAGNATAGVVVKGSVYGGGNLASVGGNTTVNVGGGTIGTETLGGADYGNVYGGGKGKTSDPEGDLAAVKSGLVLGNTNVNISNGTILHSVYGGGAFGSVGTYTYDTSGTITEYTSGGTTNITITGGTIGTTGQENGMVYGSSRGDVDVPGSIQDRLAWVYETHVVIGTSGQGTTTTPLIKGSVYGSGENGHTYQNTIVDVHSGTIGIASGVEVEDDNGNKYQGAAYPNRGNVYGGGCGTDTYSVTVTEGEGQSAVTKTIEKYNPLAGIVQGTTRVNIDGGLVVHNVYGAGAMGSVGIITTTTTGSTSTTTITSGGTTAIAISGGTVGVSGTVADGNVFGAARGDANNTQTDVALVKTTDVNISQAEGKTTKIYGNVYGGGECGDVGTYTTDPDDANIYPEGSGVCNVTVTGGIIGDDGNGHGNVFGAGKGDAGTFKCMKAMVYKTNVAVSNGTVYGNVYGGGEIGRVENDTKVDIGTDGEIVNTSKPDIKGSVFGAGKGLDTHGYSALVRGNPEVTVQGSAKVGVNVYGGGQIASVGKHSLVTAANATQHPELEEGMPFTLANTEVGVCTVTVKDKAEVTGNVFGAGKGVKPTEITNPGRMKPNGDMEYYNNNGDTNSYGPGFENAFHIYVQTLALVTETNVTIGGSATGTATKVKGSVYGGSESGFVQYHTNVDIQANCEIGTSSVEGNVYGGGLGISGNDVAGRVGGNTNLDINGGTTHGSVFGGGAYGIVKGSVDVNINDGIIDEDVYGGGALAHTNTAMWDDENSQLLEYAEVKNLIVGSSSVKGYYYYDENYELITTDNAKAEENKTYYAVYKTNVNLLGGKLRDAYGGGLGQIANATHADVPAYVYGDVLVNLNEGITATKGCIVERVFGCNNQNGTPKGKVQVYVYATQNANKATVSTDKTEDNQKNGTYGPYDVMAVYGGGNLSPYEPVDAFLDYKDASGNYTANKAKVEAARSEVYIYGCYLTSIKQVYGGGNAAPSPATYVRVEGTYEIEELFGGGNGKDDYKVYTTYYKNRGANVGYKDYTRLATAEDEDENGNLIGTGSGDVNDPYKCVDKENARTKEDRQTAANNYMYGSGIAKVEVFGGLIHASYAGSNEKGNIREEAFSKYEEVDGGCPLNVEETYGGGKNSLIDGKITMDLGCTKYMPTIFGGSKNADVNSDIELNITNGKYDQVFGGNNTSGNINGSITVNIKEDGCVPIEIGELYLGGYLAAYSIYGYKANGDVITKEDYDEMDASEKEAIVVRANPRLNIISASRIDKVYGGGYQATIVGDAHVNVNMEAGRVEVSRKEKTNSDNTDLYIPEGDKQYVYKDGGGTIYDPSKVDTTDPTKLFVTLPIGTIGNIYGGGNEADIIGNTFVEIGTGTWHNKNGALETIDGNGKTWTYNATTKKWSATGETESSMAPLPARNAATITGNVYGGGMGKADTYECKKAMVGVPDGQDNTIGNTNVIIANGTVGPVDATTGVVGRQVDANGKVIGGNVYGGGEVGRVEYNTTVTIGLNPDEFNVANEEYYRPIIGGDVYGAGAGVETHGYSALVRGDAGVTVQAYAKVNGNVYGGGEIATVGKYWVKGVNYPQTLTPPTPPNDDDLPNFMPYAPRSGGVCTVIIQDNAEIGTGSAGGNVFGAGKGVDPHYFYQEGDMDNNSKRMVEYEEYNETSKKGHNPDDVHEKWDYYPYPDDPNDPEYHKYVWEYFPDDPEEMPEGETRKTGEEKYATFLETLALVSETHVTIGGSATGTATKVKGSVYGGSENGFVQTDTDVDIQSNSTIGANVFGGGKGTEKHDAAGRVKGNTNLAISGATIAGNVYGGGELGHVGTFIEKDGRFEIQKINYIVSNTTNNVVSYTNEERLTGTCNVTINDGCTIGPASNEDEKMGNVFGAGKGKDDNFKCDKAMAMNTRVSISGGTVNGNVYGGGEIGRVEYDTEVIIGRKTDETTEGSGTGTPTINGNVFGAGRGVETHGYSALVRGDTQVTVEGAEGSTVAGNVYGGGQIASVGRYGLDAAKMPEILVDGGTCTVKILGNVIIGPSNAPEDKGNVFGAGKGVDPQTFNKDAEDYTERSRRMTIYSPTDFPDNAKLTATGTTSNGTKWEFAKSYSNAEIDDNTITKFVWEYYQTIGGYNTYLETLALATQPHVTIGGNATVNGSVFGGGELGLTKGSVFVNILDGTIVKDVYGGGSLANTNTTSTLSLRDNAGKPVPPVNGVYSPDPTPVHPTTTVNLLGGKLRNAYGGGLGQLERAADAGNNITALEDIPAKVFGDVKVNLNGLEITKVDEETDETKVDIDDTTLASLTTGANAILELKEDGSGYRAKSSATGAIVKQIFGCNNLNGSPQKNVKVHVFATQNADASHNTIGLKYTARTDENNVTSVYDVDAVYGGGNLAAYEPAIETSTNVIIEGCDLTSIEMVYGGGNAASTPATNVTINSAHEIENVFGGGNGKDDYKVYTTYYKNRGANVGYKDYTRLATAEDKDENGNFIGTGSGDEDDPYKCVDKENARTKEDRQTAANNYMYGTGVASVNIYGGRIHYVFGGSNTKGNVRKTAVTVLDNQDPCDLIIDEAYGGGRNAPMDAEAILMMSCIPGLKAAYGGAEAADIQDKVVLSITNGTFDRVFGGNNKSGTIRGSITVNVEETGCKPLIIGELYGGGNLAPYSVYGYNQDGTPIEHANSKVYSDPQVNVKSFTSIGDIYGGGYGKDAVMYGDPTVNINVALGKYSDKVEDVDDPDYGTEGYMYDDKGYIGNPHKEIDGHYVIIPPHVVGDGNTGTIGVIQNVFGGGNAAPVNGSTNVNIGTLSDVYVTVVDDFPAGTNLGTTEGYTDIYTFNETTKQYDAATGTPNAGTTYYKKLSVVGVDIRGNVYGGGNAADVTGDTNVVIGKKSTE